MGERTLESEEERTLCDVPCFWRETIRFPPLPLHGEMYFRSMMEAT